VTRRVVKAMSSCSHCGTQHAALKRCSRCKQASYCGAECQHAAWKGHKKTCVTLKEVFERVNTAHLRDDWREVLKWEGRVEEMMEGQPDDACNAILMWFANAHEDAFGSTGSKDNALSIVRLETRRVEVLGKMQRFRDQGEALCRVADQLPVLGRRQEAEGYYQRARKIAEAHGFFLIECESCLGLGRFLMENGREEEGVNLLRNALVCVPLCEGGDTSMELDVLLNFTEALFITHATDEVEPLVARFLKAAKAESQKQGRLVFWEFQSFYTSARLHEVLCTCTPCWEPPHTARPVHATKADSVSLRYLHARIKTHALVEPHALARHAGDCKRLRGSCVLCSTSCAGTKQQCKPCPLHATRCCATPPRTSRSSISRSSIRRLGRSSSSSLRQPNWPSFRCLCVNPQP